MKIAELKKIAAIPAGVNVKLEGNRITVSGQHGEVSRLFNDPKVKIAVESDKVVVSAKNASKKHKRSIVTMVAHIKNMIRGVKSNNEYKLKICASHFPMQVAMEGQTLTVKNFFGEKIPRRVQLPKEVTVKVQADKITISGPDIEKVGEAASKTEQVCAVANKDRRVFQDGIFLIEKNGKAL